VNAWAEYPEPNRDEAVNVALLHETERNEISLLCAAPPEKSMLFCLLPGQVCMLKLWLTKFFSDGHGDGHGVGDDDHSTRSA